MKLTDGIHRQVGLGRVLRNADAVLVAGHDSEVVLDARGHVGDLEAGLLQVLDTLGPGLPVHLAFLHDVVEDGAAAIILRRRPGQLSRRLGNVICLQATDGSRGVWLARHKYKDYA